MWTRFLKWLDGWRRRQRQLRFERERCPHGMPGGLTRALCSECQVEAAQAQRAHDRERAAAREAQRQAEARHREELARAARDQAAREAAARREAEAQARERAAEARRQALKEKRQVLRTQAEALHRRELARARRARLRQLATLRTLPPREFERTVSELYAKLGYDTTLTVAVGDYGADVIASRDGRRWVIECKRYAASQKVNRQVLQQLQSAMKVYGAHAAVCVTTADYSRTARAFASRWDIELVDGPRLVEMMAVAYPPESSGDRFLVMCEECGVQMRVKLHDSVIELTCPNGHRIRRDFRTPSRPAK